MNTMDEYISRKAAVESLLGWAAQLIETYGKNDEYVRCLESAAYNIEQIPAADVVPVVMCDDCINFTCGENESERWEWCILWGHDVSHDNYCSYGTKMDKDGSE